MKKGTFHNRYRGSSTFKQRGEVEFGVHWFPPWSSSLWPQTTQHCWTTFTCTFLLIHRFVLEIDHAQHPFLRKSTSKAKFAEVLREKVSWTRFNDLADWLHFPMCSQNRLNLLTNYNKQFCYSNIWEDKSCSNEEESMICWGSHTENKGLCELSNFCRYWRVVHEDWTSRNATVAVSRILPEGNIEIRTVMLFWLIGCYELITVIEQFWITSRLEYVAKWSPSPRRVLRK